MKVLPVRAAVVLTGRSKPLRAQEAPLGGHEVKTIFIIIPRLYLPLPLCGRVQKQRVKPRASWPGRGGATRSLGSLLSLTVKMPSARRDIFAEAQTIVILIELTPLRTCL